ncbi:hypothetical protein ACV22V_31290 [Burkholderia sp. AW33-5]
MAARNRDARPLLRRRVQRRIGGRDRLEHAANRGNVRRKGRIRPTRQAPADDMPIDDLPLPLVDHARADLRAHVDHPARDQLADRFAQQRAAYA